MIEPTNNDLSRLSWHGRMIMLMLLLLTSLTIYSQGQTATLTGSLEKAVAQNYPNQGGGNGIGGSSSAFDGNNKTFTVKGVTFTMVAVEGGAFMMGATSEQGSDAFSDGKPVHQVTLSSYYIGQTEVTQALWEAVMGNNPSRFKGDNKPVTNVNWDDCQDFVIKLNQLTGKRFRLPTEAEWEYACRGGKKSRGYKYSGSNTINDVAWYYGNSSGETHPVAIKSPNELGIYDMSGNVCEWCQDWKDSYSSAAQTNPTGASSGSYRVGRGGSWYNSAEICRVFFRYSISPGYRTPDLGLRLVFSE